jgi:phosphatidylinositol alpha-1,6-mannosyltransferase
VSRYSEKKFRKWAGANKATTLILPNCVDLDTFVPRPKNPSFVKRYGLNGAEVLLTVGRLATEERYKGIDEVIELMPKLLAHRPKLRYLIVGDGSDRARLEAKASVLGVAHAVIFAGRIPEEEKVDHYNLASVYVMPSTGEGFGIVLIEAAACGLTIVGSAVDGSREALLEGTLGTLTDPRDLVSLEQTILESLDKNSERSPNPAVKTFGEHAFRERVWAWSKEQSRTTGHGA